MDFESLVALSPSPGGLHWPALPGQQKGGYWKSAQECDASMPDPFGAGTPEK